MDDERDGPDKSDRFCELTLRYFDGDLSDRELAEFNACLGADAQCRRQFVEFCTRSILIRETFDPERQAALRRELDLERLADLAKPADREARQNATSNRRPPKKRSVWWIVLAASLAVVLGAISIVATYLPDAHESSHSIASLENLVGDVRIVTAAGESRESTDGGFIQPGDTIRTRGSHSSTIVSYADGTKLTLVGDTAVTCGDSRAKSLIVHQGTLAGSVQAQPQGLPMVLATPSARLRILGTRFLIEALANRTDLSVTEGLIELVRLRDKQSVEVAEGEFTSVTEQNNLRVQAIPSPVLTWDEDFETGLPDGWANGEWVRTGLPPGSHGAVKAQADTVSEGKNTTVASHEAWLHGLFAVQGTSHLNVTFKTNSERWINIFIVTRTTSAGDVQFSGNYLLEDFPKTRDVWQTVTIPLRNFQRIHAGSESLIDVVPFKLLIVSDDPRRELIIDRMWVTADGPGEVVSKVLDAQGL